MIVVSRARDTAIYGKTTSLLHTLGWAIECISTCVDESVVGDTAVGDPLCISTIFNAERMRWFRLHLSVGLDDIRSPLGVNILSELAAIILEGTFTRPDLSLLRSSEVGTVVCYVPCAIHKALRQSLSRGQETQ
jgi:hypothetical protein